LIHNSRDFVDWHCHLLPGLDDGAADLEESVEMARILAAAGFREVHCTPHCIKGAYENAPGPVREEVAGLQRVLDEAGIPLRLQPGMEYPLDEFLPDVLADPLPLGDSSLILIEAPFQTIPPHLADIISQVIRRGLTPLIAHPERCELFDDPDEGNKRTRWIPFRSRVTDTQTEPPLRGTKLLERLRDMGCLFQGNIGSFAGFYGERGRRKAEQFRAMGLYSRYGSDLHSARHRGILLMADDILSAAPV
jgi:protein-tyrosine phosphatase